MNNARKSLILTMRRDERYKRLTDALAELDIYRLDFERLETEVFNLHGARSVRSLQADDVAFVDKLTVAETREISSRSRVAEIKMQALRVRLNMERATKALRDHFLVKYAESFRAFRTKEERLMVIEAALRPAYNLLDRASTLLEICDVCLSDIDRAYWPARLIVDAYNVNRRPERNL